MSYENVNDNSVGSMTDTEYEALSAKFDRWEITANELGRFMDAQHYRNMQKQREHWRTTKYQPPPRPPEKLPDPPPQPNGAPPPPQIPRVHPNARLKSSYRPGNTVEGFGPAPTPGELHINTADGVRTLIIDRIVQHHHRPGWEVNDIGEPLPDWEAEFVWLWDSQ